MDIKKMIEIWTSNEICCNLKELWIYDSITLNNDELILELYIYFTQEFEFLARKFKLLPFTMLELLRQVK